MRWQERKRLGTLWDLLPGYGSLGNIGNEFDSGVVGLAWPGPR